MEKYNVIHFNSLNSTNTYSLEHFSELKDRDVVVTDVQTSGRGRFDRVWQGTSSENLYMTFVIKPETVDNYPFMNLTQYLSVVINRILNKKYAIMSNIKWPNDILFNGKKISGILAETKIENNMLKGVVLGVGINLNTSPAEIIPNAISLKEISGKTIDKDEFMTDVLSEFYNNYDEFVENGFNYIYDEYSKMCCFNEELKIGNSYREGEFSVYKFRKLNKDGTLTVSEIGKEDNKDIKIVSGDILC